MNDVKMKGIDISHWNDIYDYDKLAEKEDFAMLKLGGEEGSPGKFKKDKMFDKHYTELSKRNVAIGVYFFMSMKKTVIRNYSETARKAADWVCEQLKGLTIKMPVAIDVEGLTSTSREEVTAYVNAFCSRIEEKGYYVTVYGSEYSTFAALLNLEQLGDYDIWVAKYSESKPHRLKRYGMWQYTSKGATDYCHGRIDKNYAYYDYPCIIEKAGLNHLKEEKK